jgi:endonuclease-3
MNSVIESGGVTAAGASIRHRLRRIVRALRAAYPEAACNLVSDAPFQLLVKTILSAQCTDERVNAVGDSLFRKYATVEALADAKLAELEEAIRPTGFYRNKARHIRDACRMLVDRFDGQVPDTMDGLLQLPGVGRKTANVMLGNAFGRPALAVDTHVMRLSRRLGLTAHANPENIERDLTNVLDPEDWVAFSHLLGDHGRRICIARRPRCASCFLRHDCPSRR